MNLYNLNQKIEKLSRDTAELVEASIQCQADMKSPNYDQIKAFVIARAELLAKRKKMGLDTSVEVAELKLIHKLMDAMDNSKLPSNKQELAEKDLQSYLKSKESDINES